VKKAIIAIEDVRFYYHPVLILSASSRFDPDIKAGGMKQGAAPSPAACKDALPEAGKIPQTEDREAALSVTIEKRYTKDEILGLYLNQAYFGTRAYGIEAASQTYFGKSTKELTIGEAALIASLPRRLRSIPHFGIRQKPESAARSCSS